jgi:thioredoxin-like negative regulator of GroEL
MVVTVTLVHAPACHLCDDARTALKEFERDYDLAVELVEADSDVGQETVARHRPAMFPLVLVDGAYFSTGRLPRGKLRALLAARAAAEVRS